MGSYRIDPRKQFSKKLARWTAVFWFVYMLLLSIIMYLQPSVAQYTVYMSIVVSVVMLINIYSYCKNSLTEKILLAMLDKTRLELKVGNSSHSDESDPEEQEEEGVESNG